MTIKNIFICDRCKVEFINSNELEQGPLDLELKVLNKLVKAFPTKVMGLGSHICKTCIEAVIIKIQNADLK